MTQKRDEQSQIDYCKDSPLTREIVRASPSPPLVEAFQVRIHSAVGLLFFDFFSNSELKGDYRALNTHSVSPMEKIRQYQAGQTVTCFLKKVSS